MKKGLVLGTASLVALALMACGDDQTHELRKYRAVDSNKIDVFAFKDNRKTDNCYYNDLSTRPPLAQSSKHIKEFRKTQFVFIAQNENGFSRQVPVAGVGAVQEFQRIVEQGQDPGRLLQTLSSDMFQERSLTDSEVEIGRTLNRDPNPFDLELSWYTRIVFVLVGNNDQFNKENPFRVAVHEHGKVSPFYGDSLDIQANGKMLVIDYQSMPPGSLKGYDSIGNRSCQYYFELGIDQISNRNGVQMRLPIILDPDGENEDHEDPEQPGWPPTPPW